jgi:hypothetical protein
MKIKNMNAWLPKAYYPVYFNGEHIGNYSTLEAAQKAYEEKKAKE